jgi:hypothetical protein
MVKSFLKSNYLKTAESRDKFISWWGFTVKRGYKKYIIESILTFGLPTLILYYIIMQLYYRLVVDRVELGEAFRSMLLPENLTLLWISLPVFIIGGWWWGRRTWKLNSEMYKEVTTSI